MLKELERVEAAFCNAYLKQNFREECLQKATSIDQVMGLMCSGSLFPLGEACPKIFDTTPTRLQIKIYAFFERILFGYVNRKNFVFELNKFLNRDIANNQFVRLKACLADVVLRAYTLYTEEDLGWEDARGLQIGKPQEFGPSLVGVAFHGVEGKVTSSGRKKQQYGLDLSSYFSWEATRGFGYHWYQVGEDAPWILFGRQYEYYITKR